VYDSRLRGSWKSDAKKTAGEIGARCDISRKKRAKLKQMFGKLVLRYTRTHCSTRFERHTTVMRYRVVAKDACSVATVSANQISGNGSGTFILKATTIGFPSAAVCQSISNA
jgi:hypothetical protein